MRVKHKKKLQRKKTPIDKWMLENIEITLWQCVTTVPVSESVFFLGGSKELRQCAGDCIFWNKDELDLNKSSLKVTTSLLNPHLWARFKKASTLPAWPADTNTPQAGRAYNKRDTIKPVKTVFIWSVGSPWLRSSRSRYIRWLHCFKISVTCRSYDNLCCITSVYCMLIIAYVANQA